MKLDPAIKNWIEDAENAFSANPLMLSLAVIGACTVVIGLLQLVF